MKSLTLVLSDAQFERLQKIGDAMRATPHEIAVSEIFEGLDGWESWEQYEENRPFVIRYFADTGHASRQPRGKRLEDMAPKVPSTRKAKQQEVRRG